MPNPTSPFPKGQKNGARRRTLLVVSFGQASGRLYAFPNDEDGLTEQWELFDDGSGRVDARRVRGPWDVGGPVEGCVADDDLGHRYIGEEEAGIWKYGAEPDAPTDARRSIDSTGRGGHLTPDVEGLAIRYGPGGSGLLIASSQGDIPSLSTSGPRTTPSWRS